MIIVSPLFFSLIDVVGWYVSIGIPHKLCAKHTWSLEPQVQRTSCKLNSTALKYYSALFIQLTNGRILGRSSMQT